MKKNMKKIPVSAILAGALFCLPGAASAAENPFDDVPADHWAYDAIQGLAADGIVEGYGDRTYRGDRILTRFEMAQMTARAMAKGTESAAHKAAIDKLAAEFRKELEQLGVRLEKLEQHADVVKWTGTLRYRYRNIIEEDDGIREKKTLSYGTLRLEPSMDVTSHWTARARIDFHFDMKNDLEATSTNQAQVKQNMPTSRLERIWAQGDYENLQIRLGRLPYLTIADHGMIFDEALSGVQITYGKKIKGTLTAGRSRHLDSVIEADAPVPRVGSYQAIEIYNDREERFTWGLGFHRWANREALYPEMGISGLNIYAVGLGYKFDKNFSVKGAFSWTNSPVGEHETVGVSDPVASDTKRAFTIEFDYKKADPAHRGSFGMFAAYRQLGHYASIHPTYDAVAHGHRGVEIGADYVFDKNVMGTIKYFLGKKMPDEDGVGEHLQSAKTFFGELNFFF